MAKATHFSKEDDFNKGYSFGTVAGASDEVLDFGEQDEEARYLYETIEGHEPGCQGDCAYCRMIGNYDAFAEGFSTGYTTSYTQRHQT
jgi:hypothetical protein